MLLELRVRDFAIIDDVTLRLAPGLNVLTGETGAGKSLIVGALSLLLGERAYADVVRAGATRASVEGVFELSDDAEQHAILADHGIDAEEGLLILRREVALEGRNRAWVNGSPATAALIGMLGRALVDLHGQHEHQSLLRADEQRAILDAFAASGAANGLGAADDGRAATVAAAFDEVRDAEARLRTLDLQRAETESVAATLRAKVEEIERVAPRVGEDEELQAEADRLEHAEELASLANQLNEELYLADASISSRLAAVRRPLDQLIRIDPSLDESRDALESALQDVQELGRRMGDYAANVEHDPARLERVRRRMDALYRLRARYGDTIEAVLESARSAREELDLLDRAALDRRTIAAQLDEAWARHREACTALSAARREAASTLQRDVTALLPSLGLGGRFEVGLEPLREAGRTGAESVEFRVTLNPEAPPGPLVRVASGGEISRLMLALKTVLARDDRVPTLVFDEIDAGVGGRTAHAVGDQLCRVAREHQVFVVTHLAQLAARADHHIVVEKTAAAGTSVTVSEPAGEERVKELARLLGGDPESQASLEHARELLTAEL